jgi:imidazolonepropionase-like amidohydrolase
MTPSQAIVAGTKNGAIASRGIAQFGTIEAGKRADLVLLREDPLADIHNIRKVSTVIKDGKMIDRAALPQVRVLTKSPSSH